MRGTGFTLTPLFTHERANCLKALALRPNGQIFKFFHKLCLLRSFRHFGHPLKCRQNRSPVPFEDSLDQAAPWTARIITQHVGSYLSLARQYRRLPHHTWCKVRIARGEDTISNRIGYITRDSNRVGGLPPFSDVTGSLVSGRYQTDRAKVA